MTTASCSTTSTTVTSLSLADAAAQSETKQVQPSPVVVTDPTLSSDFTTRIASLPVLLPPLGKDLDVSSSRRVGPYSVFVGSRCLMRVGVGWVSYAWMECALTFGAL